MGAITLNCFAAALFYDDVSKHMKKVKVEDDDDEQEELQDLYNGKFRGVLEDLEEVPEPLENGKKAKFIVTHDDCSTHVATPTMEHKMDIFKFSLPKDSFERSISAVVVQNMANERHRKVSTDDHRNRTVSSFTTQLNSTPSLFENNNSNMRLHRLNSNRVSRPKGLKASPSTSSFAYISTPYHGEFHFPCRFIKTLSGRGFESHRYQIFFLFSSTLSNS